MEHGKNPIQLYLISGSLGAGKTTFLLNLLKSYTKQKIGVIVNEFGNISIDGRLIERDGIHLMEINNGSIFCCCLKAEFVKTLIEFSNSDIDVLFIENSGMADPSNIHGLLNEVEKKTGRPYAYQGAVCLIDAVSFLTYVKVLTPVQNQVAASNFVLINKTDQANQVTIEEIQKKIQEINPKAYIYQTMFADIPMEILNENLSDNGFCGETSNQPYNRPSSCSLECDEKVAREDVKDFVQKLQSKIYRIKGFADTTEGWIQIDAGASWMTLTPANLGKKDVLTQTRIVCIGESNLNMQDEVLNQWRMSCHQEGTIYDKV